MSNFGQAILGIVGGVIGFLVGGPTGALYGFEAGLLAGSIISPTQLPGTSGPRLTDGNTTTASIGDPVSFGYGFFPVAGTVVYLGTLTELSHTTSSGGKGGPQQTQTTYSYTQSIGIGLCEGPIGSVRRIWENGELVYDSRPQQPDEADAVYEKRVSASDTYAAGFVLYLGDEAQLPDPTIELDKGTGNVPAFRGLAYIVYPDRLLRDDQGQRHPNFKFEIHVPLAGYDTDDIPADLQNIIALICARAGYDTMSQIDASDLADTTVDGYVIARGMTARDALTPLQSIGLFDVCESGQKLRFVKRGAAPLRTLLTSDLGAYNDPSNSDPDAAVSVTEAQDVDLPQQIRVKYIASSLDYEDGEQLSPARFDTDAVNIVDVELAVCMSDDLALQLAEILWAAAWSGRSTYVFPVDQSQADIEPADALIIPVKGTNFRVRVNQVNDSSQILRKLTAISDDDGSYVSTAVAQVPSRPPQQLSFLSGSTLLILDLPALMDSDNDAGVYAIAYGDGTGNSWSGASIYTSIDGDSFQAKSSMVGTPPIGTLVADLPTGITSTWDDENYLDVLMIKGGFESRTEDAVLAGANALAIGVDGSWEIVQFTTATLLEDSGGAVYRLSHLLRGRRGTEWAVGSGAMGQKVVAVSAGNLVRLSLQNIEIGVPLGYKAVTIGSSYASGTDQSFTGHGVALKPFSPCGVAGHFSGSDLVISWFRRDRFGKTLTSGIEIPMSEATESYEVDILNGLTVVRTLTSTTPTVTYISAQITTDFGTPPDEIAVKVYQLSGAVGRGYPAGATIP